MAADPDVASGVDNAPPTERRPPELLFWSTPESAAEGRVTVLACVETVFAVSVTLYIAWKTASLLYIAFPACVAPMLLLRTSHSTALGLKLFVRYFSWAGGGLGKLKPLLRRSRFGQILASASVVAVVFASPMAALGCRIAGVGVAMLRHPLASLHAIPRNWRRAALATDLHHPPEIVPGVETTEAFSAFRLQNIFSTFRENPSEPMGYMPWGARLIYWILVGFWLVAWFAPALFYRWSLKSTSVVYLPLLWAALKGRRGADTAAQRLDTIATDQAERLVRWYAGFVLIVLTILPAVLAAPLQPIIAPVQSAFGVELVDFWLFTGQIKLWHVVRVINAAITMGLFLFADKALRRIEHGRAYSDGLVHGIIGTGLFLRGFFGVYLAAKLLHLAVTSVDWSAVDWRIIPW